MTLAEEITQSLKAALGYPETFVPLHEPRFQGNEHDYLRDCIDSTFVSSVGAYVERFEADLAHLTGAKRAIAVSSGTAALHVAMRLAGVKEGDEVLLPALTFVATANAVRYLGSVPHFIDSNEETLGIDPEALRDWLNHISEPTPQGLRNIKTGRRIAALVPMHTFGHPCDMAGLMQVAGHFQLPIVEDAAESLGSSFQGQHTGTFGLLGTLSFNGNKVVTTGGGGAILTNDETLADHAKHLTTTAKTPHRWDYVHDDLGYNYRLPNLNAALGCAQLEELPQFLQSKRALYTQYAKALSSLPSVHLMGEPANSESNFWLQALILNKASEEHRDAILEMTNAAGLMTRPAWRLMHRLPMHADCPHAPLPIAESLERRVINIPSSAGLV